MNRRRAATAWRRRNAGISIMGAAVSLARGASIAPVREVAGRQTLHFFTE
jgi:hypothetical protein